MKCLVVGLQFGDRFGCLVAMTGSDGVADLDEGIGSAAERAEYDDLRFGVGGDQLAHLAHPFGLADRGAAKFHDLELGHLTFLGVQR